MLQAQLGSTVTVPWAPPDINSLEELVDSRLQLCAPWKMKALLDRITDSDEHIKTLLLRLKPESDAKKRLVALQRGNKDFAYLSYTKSLRYYSSQTVSNKPLELL